MNEAVSVVICTHTMDRYDSFSAAIESILEQTVSPEEVVLVIDGDSSVYECSVDDFGDSDTVSVHLNEENRGISYSRTRGAELASGDIVAFIDDDATAEPDWIESLLAVYEETDAIAVGGDVRPDWQTEKPHWFPEEFYWLVGVVEPDFATDREEVRNTYGSNISYRRELFLAVGGYDPKTGRKGEKHLQAHEAPVGIRLLEEFGRGMVYAEDAIVRHKLFDYRGDFQWLVGRSFWQGYSKRVMAELYPDAPDTESEYLRKLVTRSVPERLRGLIRSPSVAGALQLVSIAVFTAAVGIGYAYALVVRGLAGDSNR